MKRFWVPAALAALWLAEQAGAEQAVTKSPRPTARAETNNTVVAVPKASGVNIGFQNWLKDFRKRALAQGISDSTLNAALKGIHYDASVIARDSNQSEFTKTIWDYLDSAASDSRIENGKAALTQHAKVLAEIEARYAVPPEVVVAVWGMESAYGTFRGSQNVVQSLATLAYDGRRGAFFEEQLLAALKIIANGDVTAEGMTGSWAGAMGHTQFIPTSYLAYAVDFRGDGKRDIWSDDPMDALASTAAYLARHGWEPGQPWGVEVTLPKDFDYALTGKATRKSPEDWAALGLRDTQGQIVPNHGAASILLPAGAGGAAFMIFDNFKVISRYNAADAYVMGVGHLSDRLAGGPAIKAAWPRSDRALLREERKELQRLLTRAGFSTGGVDGRIGPNSIKALRRYQLAQGLVPDGYPSLKVLERLR
ncbi:lytic murein transglycosylase [Alphaproteobacteria bacterium KMM 3653]|uniref:Lytic murein transglycosylase n=1 Tax=Harenicola maris TaxID=2841044 RepID=A0AAP2CN65_9RHOB|nr:lytic murein transglycosylase [Harenicola maris]